MQTSGKAEISTNEGLPSSSDTDVMRKWGQKAFVTPEPSPTLDRAKESDKSASIVVGETAASLGHNLDEVSLSRSNVRRTGQKHRKQTTEEIKIMSLHSPVIVHWDSKLMLGLQEKSTIDRLQILAIGQGQSQFLTIPKIPTSKGNSQAQGEVATQVDLNRDDMCLDTSYSTGRKNGAGTLLRIDLYILLAVIIYWN